MSIEIKISAKSADEIISIVQDLASVLPGMDPAQIPSMTTVSTLDDPQPSETDSAPESNEPRGDIPDITEIRALAREKGSTPEGKEAIKALLKKFECKSISSIPEDKRAAFMAELEAL